MTITRNNPHLRFILLLLAAALIAWGAAAVVPAHAGSTDTSDWIWTFGGRLWQLRFAPTSTLINLRGAGTGVLLVGGGNETINPSNPWSKDFKTLKSTEFYKDGKVSLQPFLKQTRALHTATLLPEGKVLVTAGLSDTAIPTGLFGILLPGSLSTCELFDPKTPDGNWTAFPKLTEDRFAHTATLVNGTVLVVGGIQIHIDLSHVLEGKISASAKTLNSAEIYDPTEGKWKTSKPKQGRALHTATLLANGKVLVTGGAQFQRDAELDLTHCDFHDLSKCYKITKNPIETLGSSEIYDPTSNSWDNAKPLTQPRLLHTATLLPETNADASKVLVAGGQSGGFDDNSTVAIEKSCEIYDSKTNTWDLRPDRKGLLIPSSQHTATLMRNGKVLLVGGSVDPYASQIYDPKKDSWTLTYDFLWFPRTWHTATLLDDENGTVVVAGGVPILYERYEPPSASALMQRRVSGRIKASVPGD
jgi:hypothetical protein